MSNRFFIGTAAWNIPKIASHHFQSFSADLSALEKYSQVFSAVEINSSFYKDHMAKTYARWTDSVPGHFKFSVKLPKRFTHIQQLQIDEKELENVISGFKNLKEKLGVILVQLPPKLGLDFKNANLFFKMVRKYYHGNLAFEPRHTSWGSNEAFELYNEYKLSKVIADPKIFSCSQKFYEAGLFQYFRLHGSPEMYKSAYSKEYLLELSNRCTKPNLETWCIFDNTTFGHATTNAVTFSEITKNK